MRDINRDLALRCAEHGIAVFPCKPTDRVPLVKWRDLSTVDPQIIAGWWNKWPGALPGIDLSKIGAVVLDGDRHHPDVDGRAALREILIKHRVSTSKVPTIISPRDGVHLYLGNPGGLGNRRGCLPAGIDVKGVGGIHLRTRYRSPGRPQIPARSGTAKPAHNGEIGGAATAAGCHREYHHQAEDPPGAGKFHPTEQPNIGMQ